VAVVVVDVGVSCCAAGVVDVDGVDIGVDVDDVVNPGEKEKGAGVAIFWKVYVARRWEGKFVGDDDGNDK
jgi:hypothetical protein